MASMVETKKVVPWKKHETMFIYLGGLAILFLLILCSNRRHIFDERIFVWNLPVLEQHGLSRELFTDLWNQSPGPLYQMVHVALKPLTRYDPIAMRVVNYVFLWLIITFITITLRFHGIRSAFLNATLVIAIPMTWPLAGMALSEIPALLFCCAALVLFECSLRSRKSVVSYGCLLAGGLCLGLSIIGRTPFLMIFIPFVLLVDPSDWKKLAMFVLSASIIPAIAISFWRGLVPPDLASAQGGWNFWYGVLAIGYLALVTLLIVPDWFRSSPRVYLFIGGGYVLLSLVNVLFFKFSYLPLHSSLLAIFGIQTVAYISYLFPGFFLMTGLFFVIQTYSHYLKHGSDKLFVFSVLAALLISATTVKSSAQFSSRYVGQCIPFIVMYASFFDRKKYTPFFHGLGIIIGICSLVSYYVTM